MKKPVYQIHKLSKFYDNKRVLSLEGLEIFQGEIIGLSGRNGSGKSSLLRLLAFLEAPSEGEIFYKGESNPSLNTKREIAMMISEPCLLKRSVKENLLYGLKLRSLPYNQNDIFEILYLVGLEPKKFIHRGYHQLSNGEKQRVALAARLILSPKTLLLDEPTNSLDSDGLPKFAEAIRYAHKNFGSTIVIASHDRDWLEGLMSREISLHFGKLVDSRDIFYFSRHWKRDERGNLYYDFGDNQRLFTKDTSHLGKKLGVALRSSLIKIDYKPAKNTLYGKVNSIKMSENKVLIEIHIGNEKIKKFLDLKEYLAEKPLVNQEVWVEIGLENETIEVLAKM